jgi:hypothetical protein
MFDARLLHAFHSAEHDVEHEHSREYQFEDGPISLPSER